MKDEEDHHMQLFAMSTYLVAIVLFVAVWWLVVGFRDWRTSSAKYLGLGFAVVLLIVNACMAFNETVSTYDEERDESAQLESKSFNVVIAMFAFGSLLSNVRKDKIKHILHLMLPVVFFVVVLQMSPVWVSTEDARETIAQKHIKSSLLIMGLGFFTAALSYAFFDNWALL